MKRIVLASNSPRRRELLENIGLRFEVVADKTPEPKIDGLLPAETVLELSRFKGENVRNILQDDAIVISADTVVVIDAKILGKPKDADDGIKMLSLLSGREHEVYTGVYIVEKSTGKSVNFYEKTKVYFKKLDINEIKDYIDSGEFCDKAGSYGIQGTGALFVEKICGDYFNVVGLPLCHLGKMLAEKFDIKFF
ncbi:MAG: septum formation protein Maf [Clostridia bacterium]|nr:septum formation protein Maf [Clostridia bacterium]